MAAGAGRVGRAEGAANVAALTGDIGVGAIEYEARAEVVEHLLRPGLIRREQTRGDRNDKKQAPHARNSGCPILGLHIGVCHCNDLTSLNVSAV